jgi:CO/xanthine dehydrogenase Mo-binding subunit
LAGHSSGGGHTEPGQPATTGQPTAPVAGVSGSIAGGIDFTNTKDTSAAVVADIEVNKKTGKITVKHIYAAMSPGLVVNPASVANQIVGQQIMGTSRMLVEAVRFNKRNVTSHDWVSYPILRFQDSPKVTAVVVQRLDQHIYGAGEESLAGPAGAIANAFFDATGVRLRQLPATPAVVRATLKAAGVK